MAEIKGYLLTEEEAEVCVNLVKKLRERKVFAVDFSRCLRIKAKTPEEANDIFWETCFILLGLRPRKPSF